MYGFSSTAVHNQHSFLRLSSAVFMCALVHHLSRCKVNITWNSMPMLWIAIVQSNMIVYEWGMWRRPLVIGSLIDCWSRRALRIDARHDIGRIKTEQVFRSIFSCSKAILLNLLIVCIYCKHEMIEWCHLSVLCSKNSQHSVCREILYLISRNLLQALLTSHRNTLLHLGYDNIAMGSELRGNDSAWVSIWTWINSILILSVFHIDSCRSVALFHRTQSKDSLSLPLFRILYVRTFISETVYVSVTEPVSHIWSSVRNERARALHAHTNRHSDKFLFSFGWLKCHIQMFSILWLLLGNDLKFMETHEFLLLKSSVTIFSIN